MSARRGTWFFFTVCLSTVCLFTVWLSACSSTPTTPPEDGAPDAADEDASGDDGPDADGAPTRDDATTDAVVEAGDVSDDAVGDSTDASDSGDGAVGSAPRCGGCASGTKPCGTRCVSISDPAFGCGDPTCGACDLPRATAACTSLHCAVAACAPGFLDCDGDPANGCEVEESWAVPCGRCGPRCEGDQVCTPSGCASSCPFPLRNCGGVCKDLSKSPCGACTCGAPAAPVPLPRDPAPPCEVDRSACGGTCVDLRVDARHCGGCDRACGSNEICSGATCVASDATALTTVPVVASRLVVDATDVLASGRMGVFRIPKSGGAPVRLGDGEDALVDDEAIYWRKAFEIRKLPKRASATPAAIVVGTPIGSLAQDETHLYWHDATSVWRARKDGTQPTMLADEVEPIFVAVARGRVWWTTAERPPRVQWVSVAGGAPSEPLTITTEHGSREFVADDWGLIMGGEFRGGTSLDVVELWRRSTDVDRFRLLANWTTMRPETPEVGMGLLASDACTLYWADLEGLVKLPKHSKDVVRIMRGRAGAVAVDDTHVYWLDGNVLRRVAK
jgi:hypothetical protein